MKLLGASDGELETRIKIQKTAFLLGLEFPDDFSVKDFEYHYYGPYNRGLSDALQFAVSSDLIEEIDESPESGGFTKYRYVITDNGKSILKDLGDGTSDFVKKAKQLKQYHWRALELASTVKFLELNEFISRDDAMKKALILKPKTEPHKSKAVELLA